MAKPLPKASRQDDVRCVKVDRASKTPGGCLGDRWDWPFFVIGGLGISAFIVWKAIGGKRPVPAADRRRRRESSSRCRDRPIRPSGEVGVEHPSPNPMIEDAGSAPPVVTDRVEQDRMRQEVLKRIDLMRVLTDADKDKLYVQVERARGFTKIAIIPFTQNRTIAGAAQVDGLIKSLNGPDLRKLLADPTVILDHGRICRQAR